MNWWLHLAVMLTFGVNFAFAEAGDSVPRTFERSTLPNGTGVRWGQASNPGPRHSFDDPEGTPMDQEEDPQGWSPTDHSGTVHDEPPDETMLLPSNSSPAPAAAASLQFVPWGKVGAKGPQFGGSRPGLAFRLGCNGLGYYPDLGGPPGEGHNRRDSDLGVAPISLVLDEVVRSSASVIGSAAATTAAVSAEAASGSAVTLGRWGGRFQQLRQFWGGGGVSARGECQPSPYASPPLNAEGQAAPTAGGGVCFEGTGYVYPGATVVADAADAASLLQPSAQETLNSLSLPSRGARCTGARSHPAPPPGGDDAAAVWVADSGESYFGGASQNWTDLRRNGSPPGHWVAIPSETDDQGKGTRLSDEGAGPSLSDGGGFDQGRPPRILDPANPASPRGGGGSRLRTLPPPYRPQRPWARRGECETSPHAAPPRTYTAFVLCRGCPGWSGEHTADWLRRRRGPWRYIWR